MTHPFPDFLENREFPVWFILYEWTFVLQKSIIHHINECSKVERNHKGEKCKISAAFKTSTIKFSSTTSLLHRYHANDLIENTKAIYFKVLVYILHMIVSFMYFFELTETITFVKTYHSSHLSQAIMNRSSAGCLQVQ